MFDTRLTEPALRPATDKGAPCGLGHPAEVLQQVYILGNLIKAISTNPEARRDQHLRHPGSVRPKAGIGPWRGLRGSALNTT